MAVISWMGQQLLPHHIDEISRYLAKYVAINKTLNVDIYDPVDISNLVAQDSLLKAINAANDTNGETVGVVNEDIRTPEDHAVIFISAWMAEYADENTNFENWKRVLTVQVIEALRDKNEFSKELINAMFILSGENLNVSLPLMKKYNMTTEKIRAIKELYHFLQK